MKKDLVQYIARHIDEIATPRETHRDPQFTTDSRELKKEQRCNSHFDAACHHDKGFLYIENMCGLDITPRAHVTSLTI